MSTALRVILLVVLSFATADGRNLAVPSTVLPTALAADDNAPAAPPEAVPNAPPAPPEVAPSAPPAAPPDAVPNAPPAAPPAASAPGAPESTTAEAAAKLSEWPPITGSHVPEDDNKCLTCHTADPDLFPAEQKGLYIDKEKLAKDVHFLRGVSCSDCHGGNFRAGDIRDVPHAKEDFFRAKRDEILKACLHCHKTEGLDLLKGMHAKAGVKDEKGDKSEKASATVLSCEKCHGAVAHVLAPVRDKSSPVFAQNQVKTCGECHKKDQATYTASIHGQGLYQMGLVTTAVCSDCHGAHGVYLAADKRSTLHATNVAQTCGKCHWFLEERLKKSVHGGGNGPGGEADRKAPGGKGSQHPSCTSCHQGHHIADVATSQFRLELPNLCGNCHADLSNRYAMSMHGQLTDLGYLPAAKCSDCHGSHDILPVEAKQSPLAGKNRVETCRKCHAEATVNFAAFDPHADHTDPTRSKLVHGVYVFFLTLLIGTFTVFGIHTLLWFIRGLVEVLRHGRPRSLVPGQTAFVRFNSFHRSAHILLLVSFLGLALTGLPLKYSHYEWARRLAGLLGGFESTSVWHRFCALINFGCLAAYMIRLPRLFLAGRREGKSVRSLVFGPDSPVPTWRDVQDAFRMLGWFLGLRKKPTFERWAYWEKFDFWGACTDIVIIGATGLILWFPNFFCSFMPPVTLNIAKVIHSTQALLATGFVFAIHFFNTHLRADKFPADMSMLTGLVSEEELAEERPELLARLQEEGRLKASEATVPSRRTLWGVRMAGLVALGIGLAILVAILITTAAG